MHFSQWLRKRICEANTTQAELAEHLQRSPATICNWLKDRHTPEDPEDIVNIAVLFSPDIEKIGNVLLSLMLSIQYTKQHPVKTDKVMQ